MSTSVFQVGDRVRVVGCENMKPLLDVFATRVLHGEVEGEIQSLHGTWSVVKFEGHNYHMKNEKLQRIPSRTFEVICRELAEKLARKVDIDAGLGAAFFYEENGDEYFSVIETGRFVFEQGYLDAGRLAAVSAACSEIAAAYEASEGKEASDEG